MRGACVGNNRVLEAANLRFPPVTPIKKRHRFFFHEIMELFWGEVATTPDDAFLVDCDLLGSPKSHKFVTDSDSQPREILRTTTLAPFEVDIPKWGVLTGLSPVLLDRGQLPAHGAVNAVWGDDDAPAQTE